MSKKKITTSITIWELQSRGFNVYHPVLEFFHHIKYASFLMPEQLTKKEEAELGAALNSLHEVVKGRREFSWLLNPFPIPDEANICFFQAKQSIKISVRFS